MENQKIEFLYNAINKQLEFTKSLENMNSILSKSRFLYSGEFYSAEDFEEYKLWFMNEYKTLFNLNDKETLNAFENFYHSFGFRVRGYEFDFKDEVFID